MQSRTKSQDIKLPSTFLTLLAADIDGQECIGYVSDLSLVCVHERCSSSSLGAGRSDTESRVQWASSLKSL